MLSALVWWIKSWLASVSKKPLSPRSPASGPPAQSEDAGRERVEPVKEAPPAGAYLSDGKRLAEVVGIDAEGRFHLCDCREDIGAEASIVLTLSQVLKWEVVRED